MFEHITGKPPGSMFIAQEPLPILNGKVTGMAEGSYTNIPVAGAEVEIFEVDAKTGERKSAVALHRKTTGDDGVWGPFVGRADAHYEFVLQLPGLPTTHTYRSPFLRSSDVVHLRPQPFAKADEGAGAVTIMSRPRGYFGVGRDKFSLDGKVPPGINDGVPGVSIGRLAFDAAADAHRDGRVQQRDHPDTHLAGQGRPHRGGGVLELSRSQARGSEAPSELTVVTAWRSARSFASLRMTIRLTLVRVLEVAVAGALHDRLGALELELGVVAFAEGAVAVARQEGADLAQAHRLVGLGVAAAHDVEGEGIGGLFLDLDLAATRPWSRDAGCPGTT